MIGGALWSWTIGQFCNQCMGLCYDSIVPNAKCQQVLVLLAVCLVSKLCMLCSVMVCNDSKWNCQQRLWQLKMVYLCDCKLWAQKNISSCPPLDCKCSALLHYVCYILFKRYLKMRDKILSFIFSGVTRIWCGGRGGAKVHETFCHTKWHKYTEQGSWRMFM